MFGGRRAKAKHTGGERSDSKKSEADASMAAFMAVDALRTVTQRPARHGFDAQSVAALGFLFGLVVLALRYTIADR